MTIYQTLNTIANTAGANDKKTILKENMSDVLKLIFEDTYGSQKYYIKKFEPNGETGSVSIDTGYSVFHKYLLRLANREITGDAAYLNLQTIVSLYDSESQEILCRIIDRNLKVGISLDNFLDVIGQKETKFEVALAMNLDKAKGVDPTDGTYYISRKLDGVRCICFVSKAISGTYVEFRSRQNKVITTLDNLKDPIREFTRNLGPGDYVLDGEVCIMDEAGNENFQGLMKEVTRKDHTIENPRYNVFDMLTGKEFDGDDISPKFSNRLNAMHDLLTPNNNAVILAQELVTSQEVLDRWTNKAQNSGWKVVCFEKMLNINVAEPKTLSRLKNFRMQNIL